MSIKRYFLGATGLLAGCAILLSSWLALEQARTLADAAAAARATTALTAVAGLIDGIGPECKNYELTLLHHTPIGNTTDFRMATDAAFTKAYAALPRLNLPQIDLAQIDLWHDQIHRLELRLADLRMFIDKPPSPADIKAYRDTLVAMSAPAGDLLEMVLALEAPASETAGGAGRGFMEISTMAYNLRLQAISTAFLIDSLSLGNEPTTELRENLQSLRAAVNTDWNNILRLRHLISAQSEGTAAVEGLDAAIQTAQATYFNDTVLFQDQIFKDRVAGKTARERSPDLVRKNQKGLTSLKAIRDRAYEGALDLAHQAENKARQGLWGMAGLTLTIAGTTLFLWLLIRRQVVIPMIDLTHTILRLACNDMAIVVPQRHRQGEIGHLAEAIETLRRNAEQAAAAERQRREMEILLRNAQKLEALGTMASGVAHELNTPVQYLGDNIRFLESGVTDIMTLVDRCLTPLPATTSPSQRRAVIDRACAAADLPFLRQEMPTALAQSLAAVAQIRDIVQAITDFTQPGEGNMRTADLNQAITTTLTLCRHQWEHVAQIETRLTEDLPPVLCRPAEINQVLLHLIDNGIQAIADKQAGRGTLTVSTSHDGPVVEIRVSDTGTGIAPNLLDRIFEPFFTTRAPGRGTGQGLSVCHGIVVNKHGGTIDVSSLQGLGTTVTICLPLIPAPGERPGNELTLE